MKKKKYTAPKTKAHMIQTNSHMLSTSDVRGGGPGTPGVKGQGEWDEEVW